MSKEWARYLRAFGTMTYGLFPGSRRGVKRVNCGTSFIWGLPECKRQQSVMPCRRLTTSDYPRLLVRRALVDDRTNRRNDGLVGISDHREHDPVMNRIHLEHLEIYRLTFLHRIARILQVRNAEL